MILVLVFIGSALTAAGGLYFMAHRGKRLQTGGLESRFKAGITRVFEIL